MKQALFEHGDSLALIREIERLEGKHYDLQCKYAALIAENVVRALRRVN